MHKQILSDLKLCKESKIREFRVALHVCLTVAWASVGKKPPEFTQSATFSGFILVP